MRKKLEKGAIN